jgi:outer membrane protein assembly factor BamB
VPRIDSISIAVVFFATALLADDQTDIASHSWPQWRGPLANGVAPHADPPVEWDEQTSIRWKVEIPGAGHATPIVWGKRIFLQTAVPTDRVAEEPPRPAEDAKTTPPANFYQFVVLCLDRGTGDTLWSRIACEAVPHEGRHDTNSYASASPMTDGERLFVSFGSHGLFCFDLDGEQLWERDLGETRTRFGWGEAITPVVHGDSVIVNWDHEDDSFIVSLDAASGDDRWRRARDEPTTWSTPLIVEHGDRTQVIVNATNRVRSYDLDTGELLWQCGGQTVNAIPSPVVLGETVFCMSGYRGSALFALPLSAAGDVTGGEDIIWRREGGTPYVPSPLLYGERLYFTQGNTGGLTCLDARTGEVVFGPVRLPGISSLYGSPVGAAGRVYVVSRDGTAVVFNHADEFEVLAMNELDEEFDASPVAVGGQLLLRGERHLYCIERE